MRGIILNKIDFITTEFAIHNLLLVRKDYNSPHYARPNIKTIKGKYILVEPKKEWLRAINQLNLKFEDINIDLIYKKPFIQ